MDDLTEVKLMMEGGRADGLLVRHLRLEEGLCRLPFAEIEIVSKKAISMDDLETFVEQPAALEISRIDVGSTRRTTRWFSGIVTSVEHEGRILASQGGSVFGYRMTVSPNLVNLAYSQSNLQYADTAALDVVKAILDRYNVAYTLDDQLPDAAKEKHDYFQGEESDYSFLLGVLSACGLSFTCRMPRQAAGAKAVKGPMLHIGRGTGLPCASDFAADGEESDPLRLFSCDRERSDATYRRMDHWRMRKSIGTDRVEVGFVDGSGREAFGAAGAANSLRRMRLNGALSAASDKGSVGRVTEEYLKAFALDTVRWQGRTTCLEAMAGCRLEIHGFFDRTGGANDKAVEALVVATVLDCRQALPSDLVGAGEENVTRLGIELSCMDGKLVNDDRGDAALGKIDTLGMTGRKDSSPSPGRPGLPANGKSTPVNSLKPVNGYSLVQAVVTDKNGKIKIEEEIAGEGKTSNDLTGNSVELEAGYKFKAVPLDKTGKAVDPTKDNLMTVHLVMPVGGRGQGLFRVPRIGDRILVARVVSNNTPTYYLQGYLPDANFPFSASVDEATNTTAKNCEMLSLRYRDTGMKNDNVSANTVDIRRGQKKNACSELAFYNTHEGRMWDSKFNENVGFEEDLNDANSKVLANFQSTGSMQLSANNRIEMNGRNIHIGCPGWNTMDSWRKGKYKNFFNKDKVGEKLCLDGKVVVDDISELVVNADRRIILKVGGSALVIDRNGILLDSTRWPRARGSAMMDASLLVSGCRGVDAAGANINLNGVFGTTMADAAGGTVQTYAGSVQLSGSLIKQSTMTKVGAWLRLIGAGLQSSLAAIPSAVKPSDPTSAGKLGAIGSMIGNGVDFGFFCAYETSTFAEASRLSLAFCAAFKTLSALLDTAAWGVRMIQPEYKWDKPAKSGLTMMDGFVIASMLLKLGAFVAGWVELTAKVFIPSYNTKVTLKPRGIWIDAPKLESFTLHANVANGPAGGLDIKDIAHQNDLNNIDRAFPQNNQPNNQNNGLGLPEILDE